MRGKKLVDVLLCLSGQLRMVYCHHTLHMGMMLQKCRNLCSHWFFLQILQFWGNAEDFGKRKVGLQGWLDLSRRKINNFLSIFGIFTSYTIQSTLSPVPRTVLRYTLGRLRSSFTVTGLHRPNELMIFPSTVGGAEAVRAMKGAFVRALRPPILSKAVQNWGPLQDQTQNLIWYAIMPGWLFCPYHSWIRWASSTATSTRCYLKYGTSKILLQGAFTTVSGDMNTKVQRKQAL